MMHSRDRKILCLALPSIISNITVPLLGLIDLAIVGHMGAPAYIGAVAVGSMIFNVIYWIFGFLRMGTSGLTSQALGRRDLMDVMSVLQRSLLVAMVIAGCFLVLQFPLRWAALTVMRPSATIWSLAASYFDICIWGAPAMLGLYSLTGWYVGMQNTRVPMIVAIFQNVVNIIASLLLVFVAGMGIEGVALGTLIAQWSGFALSLLLWSCVYRRLLKFSQPLRVVVNQQTMGRFFTVNRDIFLRTLFLVGVNLFFLSAGARQGDLLLSVNTLLMTFFTLFSYVMDGFAYAGEALSGRYVGAGNGMAFREVLRGLFRWGVIVTVLFTLLYIIGGHPFLSLLTDDALVLRAAEPYRLWACLIPLAGVAAFVLDGIFIGMTATRGMLVATFMAAASFFLVFWLLRPMLHNHALWIAFLVFLAMRGVVQCLWMKFKIVFPTILIH